MFQDLRFGLRMLLKHKGFTLVVVLTLALGIGANTALFSVVNAVLLRPLPYPESKQLIWLAERGTNWTGGSIAYPNFADWRAQQTMFEKIGVYRDNDFVLSGRNEPEQLSGAQMSADAFFALKVQPALGRVFSENEDKVGAEPVVVISHSLWQRRFGGDPGIVNQAITLDGRAHTVVGVMPPGFDFPNDAILWVPFGPLLASRQWQDRSEHPGLFSIGRLKPGAALEQARAELDAVAVRLEQEYPQTNKNRRVQAQPLLEHVVGGVSWNLWTMFGAVGLVLLIACANVANLLLARSATRQKEMAVRAALGAGRLRIIRQLLIESLLLAALGGAAGLLLARSALSVIVALLQNTVPRVAGISLDGTVLIFSAGMILFTGVLFGLAPAWQASRVDLQDAMKSAARSIASGRRRLRHGLVVAEVALTLPLLIGAGLLLRSLHQLQHVHPGFVYDRVLSFRVDLPSRKYPTLEQRATFFRQLQERLRGLPGVEAVNIASKIPLDGRGWDTQFLVEGRPEPAPGELPYVDMQLIGPDYFRTLGIPLLRGRVFTDQDDRRHLHGTDLDQIRNAGLSVIIVDEEFARRLWPNQDAIGQRIRLPWGARDENPVLTVVGVVGRVKLEQLNDLGGNVQAYMPFLQAPRTGMTVVMKTSLPPDALIASVRQQILALDPEQPIHQILTLAELRAKSATPQRLNLTLLGTFAMVALVLAAIGLYGVVAFLVTQRQQEIGVRVALGAQSRDVLGLVLRQGIKLTGAGILIGLAAAFALTRVLRNLLFGIGPTDPFTFAAITVLLVGVALLACWVPARRATKVDPLVALRHE